MRDPVLIDTNVMPIAEVEGHPGKRTQILLPPGEWGGGIVKISYWPPGFTAQIRALISSQGHRHYHRTVNERHYVLAGDWTSLNWLDAQAPAYRTRLYRHHYLENPPMTLHGITPEAPPVAGTKFLVWTSGPGTDIYEPEAEFESIDVPFGADVPSGTFDAPIVFNAAERRWLPHPQQDGWLVKPLSGAGGAGDALPPVTLVNVPPAGQGTLAGLTPVQDRRHWLFVLSGDLALKVTSATGTHPAALSEGSFLAWAAGSEVTGAGRLLSEGGCVALCVGHALGRPLGVTR